MTDTIEPIDWTAMFDRLATDAAKANADDELAGLRPGESLHAYFLRRCDRIQDQFTVPQHARYEIERLRGILARHPGYEQMVRDEAAAEATRRTDAATGWLRTVVAERIVQGATNAFDTDALRAVRDWAPRRTMRGLMLRGGVGVGKTAAAAWWLWDILRTDPNARVSWYRHEQIVGPVLHAYDTANNKPVGSYAVIDDVGRETHPQFQEALCVLLEENRVRLLLTSNVTAEVMRKRYEIRTIERLHEFCRAQDIAGESIRRKDGNF